MGGLSEIRFIDQDPFSQSYQERGKALRAADAADLEQERQQHALDEQRATDSAFRSGVMALTSPASPAPSSLAAPLPVVNERPSAPAAAMPAPLPAAPHPIPAANSAPAAAAAPTDLASQSLNAQMARRIAQRGGSGKMAFALMQQEQQRQDRYEEMAIKALGTGDVETFRYFQAKANLKIPAEVLQSAEARANFARALDIAKQNYHDDPAQGQVFAQTFMATPGDYGTKLAAAAAQAGPPRTKAHWTATTVVQNGREVLAFYDANSRGDPSVTVTGHQKPANSYGTQYLTDAQGNAYTLAPGATQALAITAPDGQPFHGAKMGAPGRAGANIMVKVGQKTGAIYPVDHEGAGEGGEPVAAMPSADATRLAIAVGNNQTRTAIAQMTGENRLAVAGVGADARRDVESARGETSLAQQTLRNQGAINVQDARNAGAIQTQLHRNEGAIAVQDSRGAAAVDVQSLRNQGGADTANINADARRAVADTNAWSRETAARTGADARRDVAQMKGAATGGGGGSVYAQKRAAWLSVHPGDEAGALDYAAGRRGMSPQDEEKAAASIAKAEFSGTVVVKPEKVRARIQEILTGWRGQRAAPPPGAGTAIPPGSQPMPPPLAQQDGAPVPAQPVARAQKGPDGRDYPMVATEAEYTSLPPGSVYFHAAKGRFLTKGH